jgi:hypothetical protein
MDASDFVLGGFASMGATLFTNPLEVSFPATKLFQQSQKKFFNRL